MKITSDMIRRAGGGADDDHRLAAEFCKEALQEVEKRFAFLKALSDGEAILDSKQLRQQTTPCGN